jgi:hypothetical protein
VIGAGQGDLFFDIYIWNGRDMLVAPLVLLRDGAGLGFV